MTQDQKWLLSAVGAGIATAVLLVMFIRALRRVLRREPLAVYFMSEPVQSDDPFYSLAALKYLGPYIAYFGIIAVVGGLALLFRLV